MLPLKQFSITNHFWNYCFLSLFSNHRSKLVYSLTFSTVINDWTCLQFYWLWMTLWRFISRVIILILIINYYIGCHCAVINSLNSQARGTGFKSQLVFPTHAGGSLSWLSLRGR